MAAPSADERSRARRLLRRRRDEDLPWNPRESDLPGAAIFAGVVGAAGTLGVWVYYAYLSIRGVSDPRVGQRYLLFVLGAVADLAILPSCVAIGLGVAGAIRRGVGPRWRRRAAMGLALGVVGLVAVVARFAVANA